MPDAACDKRIICPCSDDPISNYSAEAPDAILFRRIGYFVGDPPMGWSYSQLGCKSLCESSVSQEEANLCAQRQAQECVWNDFDNDPDKPPATVCTPPLCDNPVIPAVVFTNQRQECTRACSDGVSFTAVVAVGTVAGLTQAIANALAFSLACQRATFPQAICFSSARNLQEGCKDTSYSTTVTAGGGVAVPYPYVGSQSQLATCQADPYFNQYAPLVYTWEIVSGSLPTGLQLRRCSGVIDGTPTTAGTYTFTIRVTDQAGNFQQKEFQLCIFDITSTSPLPSGQVGTAYSQSISANPTPASSTDVWTIIAGTLPPGLELDPDTGIISGTPTTVGSYQFTVQMAGSCP